VFVRCLLLFLPRTDRLLLRVDEFLLPVAAGAGNRGLARHRAQGEGATTRLPEVNNGIDRLRASKMKIDACAAETVLRDAFPPAL